MLFFNMLFNLCLKQLKELNSLELDLILEKHPPLDRKYFEVINFTPELIVKYENKLTDSIIIKNIYKYPHIACDLNYQTFSSLLLANNDLKDSYFKCQDKPWDHSTIKISHPEWFKD